MKGTTNFLKTIIARTVCMCGLGCALSLAGCATYVPIESVRAPTIDTGTIQRLAIRQFENKSGTGGQLGAQITRYLTDKATQIITAAGKFTIVSPSDPNAEGVFTGEIRSIEVKNSREQARKTDKDGNIYIETTYKRDVTLEFTYTVISTRTDMPIGLVSKQGSSADSVTGSPNKIADPLTLAQRIVDDQMSSVRRDIVPTIVSTNRKLMSETLKDKTAKQRMKDAAALVKNGNYNEAIRQYDAIGSEYGSVAAVTNAGILRESVASRNAARAELNRLFNDTDGLADKAAANAVAALNSNLPSGANIMIIKTRSPERAMLDYAADEMTKTLVQAGKFRVIDRSNQALINTEQQFQLSGNVSDDSIVSIGHQLGVQYIVLCWISGEKSLRRLNLKVLNIETGEIAEQNNFEI